MEGSGPSPGYGYGAAPAPRSMDRYDDFMPARSPVGHNGRGKRAEYFATYGSEGINLEEKETAGMTSGATHERQHESTMTTTKTTKTTTKRVTVNADAEAIAEELEARRVPVDAEGKIPSGTSGTSGSRARARGRAESASASEPPSSGETGGAPRANVTPLERSVGKAGGNHTHESNLNFAQKDISVGKIQLVTQQRRTTEVTTTATAATDASKPTLHPAEQRRRERWAEEERRRQLVSQAKARAQVEGGGIARRAVATMAGKSLTVVKRSLAPLRAGGEKNNMGKSEEKDGSKQSPLYAVWAIVQAYAIVALVCTVYNSVFGRASHSKVPDEVQVRMLTSLVGPSPSFPSGPVFRRGQTTLRSFSSERRHSHSTPFLFFCGISPFRLRSPPRSLAQSHPPCLWALEDGKRLLSRRSTCRESVVFCSSASHGASARRVEFFYPQGFTPPV